jgi:hypothetical protein
MKKCEKGGGKEKCQLLLLTKLPKFINVPKGDDLLPRKKCLSVDISARTLVNISMPKLEQN